MPRRSTGRVTLQDIAERVGVSKVTVSRCLREPQRVSETVRLRIEEAIEVLDYIPNRQAGALSSGRSLSVALLVPSISNSVFSEVQRGVDEGLREAGYQVLMGHTGYSILEEERLIDTFLAYGVDGFVLSSTRHTDHAQRLLTRARLPVVETMELTETPLDVNVGLDQRAAGRAIGEALIAAGYRRIGFCGARLDYRVQLRLAGWEDALKAAGLSTQRCQTTPRPSSYRLGGELLSAMLERWPDMDAVFCCNDDLAAGALFECQRRRLEVPGQLALAGFNGLDITDATWPTLTTVITPRRAIGEQAARLIVERLQGAPHAPSRHDMGFEIALRQST
ncbi:LacI family DNA-binding transcriptional regulator [Chromohalobacter canadensis]|uniref:LacI family DNA-binding transcriptional regulator n=1 Tax=Chromohalobacter canadensis TaxID=141389 RepID=A0A285VL50_9GAMM|nr:LacI family DNA-binding transcriptional regulator [Chromohalobacter canadensis]MCK0768435.1 LacI family DNA-binding transcriptional regulator [Chromohalobacter canadensis]WQH08219.1 LacI family DNA-binding transcriptional regulator [Chromohalobacter canadensis]SOC54805.1 transcriptional regulator, LacI family [Chromohalobacter canadensis]